ncbi:hypothetical protein INR49_028272 [Caranx melampygus]|nr:hypothetical protein INR49_028272 [Caranx melampygus]
MCIHEKQAQCPTTAGKFLKASCFSRTSRKRRRLRPDTSSSNPSSTSSFLFLQFWAAILFLPRRRMSLIRESCSSLS